MLKKNLFTISIAVISLSTFIISSAQEQKIESIISQNIDVNKYMEVIAADSTMRKEMMSLMIGKCKGNKDAMKGMAKSMTQNSEMNEVLVELMKDDVKIYSDTKVDKKMKDVGTTKNKMLLERTKTIKKPRYNSD